MEKISEQYYNRGREKGKQEAVEIINQELTRMVFPPLKKVDNSYS
jgi:hypothetical protein